jgi:hypothetical protein
MPELSFRIGAVAPLLHAAIPTLGAPVEIRNDSEGEEVQSISLNCQVQIETLGRPYSAAEEAKLLDLFGERERWARTMKPMLWVNSVVKIPSFKASTSADIMLPCTLDFEVAATKYFYGLDAGEVTGTVLFSGTVFYAGADGVLQIAQIPWNREARFRFSVEEWKRAIDAHYSGTGWLRLSKQSLQRIYLYKVARGLPTWEQTIDQLLDCAEIEEVSSKKVPVVAGEQR